MRLAPFASLVIIVGLTLPACGGESVEDRARTLKAGRQTAPAPTTDPNASAPLMTPMPAPMPAPMPTPMPSSSSSAAPGPVPAPAP